MKHGGEIQMTLLEEYKRINEVEREYIKLLNKAEEDTRRKSKFNKIVALENEAQQEVQELIDRKKEQRKWFEEVGNEIVECFWKVDKTLSLNDIKKLVPVVIKHLENI